MKQTGKNNLRKWTEYPYIEGHLQVAYTWAIRDPEKEVGKEKLFEKYCSPIFQISLKLHEM